MIDSLSFPTLNTATAWTPSVMPCLVTHGSFSWAWRRSSETLRARERQGQTKTPFPVATRRGAPSIPLAPAMTRASFGAGTL